ncbi:MAG: serine protein kinase RIO [Candidatus Micrarchaeota archaeon]|nr:serine protein kinase RIO [Candidatus Micrarchaeota archaeon]
MARMLSKKKRPSREEHPIAEQRVIEAGVFSRKTMIYLSKVFNKGIVARLEHPVARGKEADVYVAMAGDAEEVKGKQFVILKMFRIDTSSFHRMMDYISGDTRFIGVRGSKARVIDAWCRKEYGNLLIALRQGILAPKPYMFVGNILAMEFIGDKYGTPAPMLKDAELERPGETLDEIIESVKKLYSARLVHADLSEYNILIHRGRPYMMDLGQAVVIKHPKADEFLVRDVHNLLQYFRKRYGVERSESAVLNRITG